MAGGRAWVDLLGKWPTVAIASLRERELAWVLVVADGKEERRVGVEVLDGREGLRTVRETVVVAVRRRGE